MKLKLQALAAVIVGVAARLLVSLAEYYPSRSSRQREAAIDAAVEEAVRQGGYRTHQNSSVRN